MKTYLELSDFFHENSFEERLISVAKRIKEVRKRRKLSQLELSEKSSVSYGTIKRFERSGKISFEALFKVAIALGVDNELDSLFSFVPPTYEEMIYG